MAELDPAKDGGPQDGKGSGAEPGSPPAGGSVGARLRVLREARGLSQEEVSVNLKFGVRQIRALEDERWGDLPHGMSLRGFVRNYARLLGADPEPLLAEIAPRVQATDPVSLEQASSLSSPIARSSGRGWPSSHRRPAPWVIGGIMLIVAAALLGFALMQQGKLPFGDAKALLEAPAQQGVEPAAPGIATEVAPLPALAGASPTEPPPALGAGPSAAVPEPAPAPTAPADSAPAQAGAAPPAAVPAAAGLALHVTESSWVEVRRANGTVALSQTLPAGGHFEVESSGAPLRVVIGNVKGVTLSWRGTPVDLSSTRDNVARLTLQ